MTNVPIFLRSLILTSLIVIACCATALSATETNVPGKVYVKMKPAFSYMNADGSGMRTKTWSELVPGAAIEGVVSFSTIAKANAKKQTAAAKAKSAVDIRLYHQLSFDPSIPVEVMISQLLKSGVVEMAEPVYLDKAMYKPNDPRISNQYYLDLVKAFQGWDISKGSPEVIIAILDSGVDASHPDLAANIYTNEADQPGDGIDNDNDGFIDNYWGWDFAGSDYQTLEGDNDPRTDLANANHGTMVAGAASAVTDNTTGIAGLGFNAKLMILKHTADNDDRNEGSGYLSNILQGVLYAATHGADIINASYGSTQYSQISQDIYKYAALEFGVLIVAAAGNENSPEPHFPSDFDYVLSVAATNELNERAEFSNFGFRVDISAPGAQIYTTDVKGAYTTTSGTSFSAPIVSGAAALVKTMYPDFTGTQVGEVLRVTANPEFREQLANAYKNKMGRGLLDVSQALTKQSPSIRMDNSVIVGPDGDVAKPGSEATIYGNFTNFLWPASGAKVTLVSESEFVTIVQSTVDLGSMIMLEVKNNTSNPFKIQVSSNVPANTEVALRLEFAAAGYTDYQYIKVLLNPSFYNVTENLVATSIAGNGRVGFQDNEQKQGLGFVFNDVNMLFEMGLMMGVSKDRLVNTVRGTRAGSVDDDFKTVYKIQKNNPGTVSDVDVFGTFNDAGATTARQLDVVVDYRAFAWRDEPYEKMVLLEYQVKNTGATPLNDFYLGLYADWDINQTEGAEGQDKADWDATTKTGYVYTPTVTEQWVAGIQVLTGNPHYWAIDNDATIANNPFGVYDGFTYEEKFKSLSSGIGRKQAGITGNGNDVSHTVSSGPYTIAAGDSITVAFALHGGSSIQDVLTSAAATELLYKTTLDVKRPVTGLEKREIIGLKVYPNPTKGLLTVSLPTLSIAPVQVRVLDVNGKQLLRDVYPQGQSSIQLRMPQQPGLYLLEVNQGDKRSIRRIVVQ